MTTLLPQDDNNNPIPALRFRSDGAHSLPLTGTTARNTDPFAPSTRIVSLYATGDIYLRLGDSNVEATATDHFFPANTYYDISLGNSRHGRVSHIAAISVGSPCTLYISEKE